MPTGNVLQVAETDLAQTLTRLKSLGIRGALGGKWASTMLSLSPSVWWRMDSAAGIRTDSSGNNRTATFGEAPAAAAGLLLPAEENAGAGLFNGSTTRLSDQNTTWPNSNTVTLLAFVQTTTVPLANERARILDKDYTADAVNYGHYSLHVNDAGKAVMLFRNASGTAFTAVSTTTITDGQPHLVVGTYDNATKSVKIYVDSSVAQATTTLTGTSRSSTSLMYLTVGATTYTSLFEVFNGTIDEATAWAGTALTPAQIQSLINSINGPGEIDSSNRVAYTRLFPVNQVSETDLAQQARATKSPTLGQINDDQTVQSVTVLRPLNSAFASRDDISDEVGSVPTTALSMASVEAGEYTDGLLATLWWEWTAPTGLVPTSVTFAFDFAGQSGAGGGSLRLYDPITLGTMPGLSEIVVRHDPTGASGTATVTFTPVAGTTYYLQQGIREKAGTTSALRVSLNWASSAPPTPSAPSLKSHVRAVTSTVITMPTPTLVDGVPQNWVPSSAVNSIAGFFVVTMGPQGGAMTDVTYFREVPTLLESYTFLDPFTYGTASIRFPQITAFDNLDGLGFLGTEDNPANVDIWFFAAAAGSDFRNPLTGALDLTYGAGTKLWEGFIVSREMVADERGTGLSVQCQGALFQADYYKQKPFYPRRPFVMERLIYEVLHPDYGPGNQQHWMGKPHLRTKPVYTRWPAGWAKKTPERKPGEPNLYTPVIPPNRLWTGFITRTTGSWESTLTGYIADLLACLYTTDDSGVTAGDQWTLRCEANRQPVLEVRSRTRAPDFEMWISTPGLTIRVNEDYTQIENALYGEGTGVDGVSWRNAYVTGAWNRTVYEPLVAVPAVHPVAADDADSPGYDPNVMVRESKTAYPVGMDLPDAVSSATKRLATAQDAGLAGTMSLRVDPSTMSKWSIKAGMTVKIKGLRGSGATGINFHIAEAVHDIVNGTVECKIDTKYRDLLTLEEARARNIDPLTPSRLLQVNKRSVMVEDVLAPWDYHMGSGYIPRSARYGKDGKAGTPAYNFFSGMPANQRFPWQDWTTANPPSRDAFKKSADGYTKGPYVRVTAGAAKSKDRWSIVEVITAQKASIRRIEVACYDSAGRVLEIPFHVSFYLAKPTPLMMPSDGTDYSPFRVGAFQSTDESGIATPNDAPPNTFLIGWGSSDQPAGHSPGLASEGYPSTGKLVDEAEWSFDNSSPESNGAWDPIAAAAGKEQPLEAITIYAAFYAEWDEPVFFLGRLYKKEQA